MDNAKIQFSEEELALMSDAGILLVKRSLLGKVETLLGNMAGYLYSLLHAHGCSLPGEVLVYSAKISRGEQYRELPYRILDYPRFFSKEDIFACRTFFWWANHISITLHLKGKYLDEFAMQCIRELHAGAITEWQIAWEGDEWEHDATAWTYLKEKNPEEWDAMIKTAVFCKISLVLPWKKWDWEMIPIKMNEAYQLLFKGWSSNQFPKR
jgi:hypothetical protein